jgi:DNA-binding HxlR family transcriptional regulator
MKGYGQFCPVAKGAEVFAERWTPLVLRELICGSIHFNDLHRGVPLMSRSLLSQRLKWLEEIGVLKRRQGKNGSEYHLTRAGREFAPLVQYLGKWGQRWFRSRLSPNELDVTLLVWDMRRNVKPKAFPSGRISVQFEFSDQAASRRRWWLVNDGDEVDLCATNPGYEIGLFVTTNLRTMARVWMGELPVKTAIRSGEIEVEGSRELKSCLEQWLGLSGFANIKDARGGAQRSSPDVRSVHGVSRVV